MHPRARNGPNPDASDEVLLLSDLFVKVRKYLLICEAAKRPPMIRSWSKSGV